MSSKLARSSLYPMQQQLFQQIRDKYRRAGRDWLQQYMTHQGLTKTPAYERMRGDKPISFDEGLHWIRQEGIPWQPWPEAPAQVGQFEEELLQDLTLYEHLPDRQIMLVVQDLPMLYLKKSRLLAGFKLYCAERLHGSLGGSAFPSFSAAWLMAPAISARLARFKKMETRFMGLPRTDVWTTHMLDHTAQLIRYISDIGGFATAQDQKQVCNSLVALIDELRLIAATPSVCVYENSLFSIGNQLLLSSSESQALYIWSDSAFNLRFTDTARIQRQTHLFECILARCRYLHPSAEGDYARFFARLTQRVQHILYDVK